MKETEVAEALDVSPSTVKSWRYRRLGPPFYRMHGAIRYNRAEVTAWHARTRHSGDGRVPVAS